jgi:hydrogenase expression/formation protein HypD
MGWTEYEPIAARYQVPIVITGFEPVDLLEGILMAVRQLEQGRAEVENQYARAVAREGNLAARRMIAGVFDIADRSWRGIGIIPKSGYTLSYEYREYDANRIFRVESIRTREPEVCIAGQVLQGQKKPVDCPAFGNECTPQTPLGATMVSAEGACAAYFNYGRHLVSIEERAGHPERVRNGCPAPTRDRGEGVVRGIAGAAREPAGKVSLAKDEHG